MPCHTLVTICTDIHMVRRGRMLRRAALHLASVEHLRTALAALARSRSARQRCYSEMSSAIGHDV